MRLKRRRGRKPKITLDEEKEAKEKKLAEEEERAEKIAWLDQLNQSNQKEEGINGKVKQSKKG